MLRIIRLKKLIKKMNLLQKQKKKTYMNQTAIREEEKTTKELIEELLKDNERIDITYSPIRKRDIYKIRK